LPAICVLLIVGCGPSPSDTYERARKAQAAGNHRAFAACLTPGSLDVMNARTCATIVTVTQLSDNPEMKKELAPLLARHGLSVLIQKNNKPGAGLFARVKDKPGLYADMMAFMSAHRKKGSQLPRQVDSLGQLTELKTSGKTATGIVTVTEKGTEIRTRIQFKKIDGSWLIDPDLRLPARKTPPKTRPSKK